MTDYKLVPIGPTPEWVANLRKVRIGRMESVIEDVLAAAPAVQGEPGGAEQQPCPEGVREGAPYDDPAFESLCREYGIWGTAAAAQCAVFWEAGKRVAEQKPAPDVAGLVEALESAKNLIANHSGEVLPDEYAGDQIEQIDAALAAHRKQGGE